MRQGIRLMFFKGTYQTTSLGNYQGEIYSGDGNILSPTCAIMGYWNPENFSGIGALYENSVSGYNDLQLKNGIEFKSGESPKNFESDGTDDYIGEVAGAYGSSFRVDLDVPWTVCMWVKFNTTQEDLAGWNPLFSIGEVTTSNEGGFRLNELNTGYQYDVGNDSQSTNLHPDPPETGRWYFVSVVDGKYNNTYVDKAFDIFIDGKYIIQDAGIMYNQLAAQIQDIRFGAYKESYDGFPDPIYTTAKAGMKIGEIMVYSGNIGLSRVIQNYNATKLNYDDSEKI
jgi:hypothetical protein